MARMWLRKARFLIERLDAHLPHKGAHMVSADLVASIQECILDTPRAQIGLIQVDSVAQVHKLSVFVAYGDRDIVDACPGQVEYPALLCDWQGMFSGNHFFAL